MDYLEKAENSESFFETIGSYKRNLNWEVVVIFYTSLQYIDSYLKGKLNLGYDNHKLRNDFIKERLIHIWPGYYELYTASIQARYMPGFKTNTLLVDSYKHNMVFIKKNILNLLK